MNPMDMAFAKLKALLHKPPRAPSTPSGDASEVS